MLVYNKQKEFTGIDETTLRRIGYNTISEMQEDVIDFADLFDNRPGLIHNFKNFSWIDFLLHTDKDETKAHIRCNGKVYGCSFKIEPFYFARLSKDENIGYLIKLIDLQTLGTDDGSTQRSIKAPTTLAPSNAVIHDVPAMQSNEEHVQPDFSQPLSDLTIPDITPQNEDRQTLDLDMDLDEPFEFQEVAPAVKTKEVKAAISTIKLDTPADYVFDPSIAADELGLPSDLIDEFVGDFIQQAEKFQPELLDAINKEDFETIQILSHKLKGVAANLRIEDALEILTFINHSKDISLLREYLALFDSVMKRLSTDTKEEVLSIDPTSELSVQKEEADDDMYAFDLLKKDEALPELATPDSDDLPEFDLKDEDIQEELEPLVFEESVEEGFDYQKASAALDIPIDEYKQYVDEFVDHANLVKNDFEKALRSGDLTAIKSIASTLKGMSQSLKLVDLTRLLEEIQTTEDIKQAISYAKELFIAIRQL